MSSLPQLFVTPEEYLEAERKAEYRSEYLDGQVYAMAGASPAHGRISVNLTRRLAEQLEDGPCEVFVLDLKVRVATAGPYFYPDLVVVCGEPLMQDQHDDVILNAKVVIEILSPSTESFDRGKKFQAYARHEFLSEYVLIAQDHVQVDHYVRQPNGHWDFTSMSDVDGVIEFPTIGARLKVADIYKRVAFDS
jgi:Uma2 family endonuclease